MRIAFVYDMAYPWTKGGAEKRFGIIAEELARRGHDVHYFTMRYWGDAAALDRNGVRYHGVVRRMSAWNHAGKRRVAQAVAFGAATGCALGLETFDVVDVCSFPFFPALLLSTIYRVRGRPHCVTWLEYTGEHWKEYLGPVGGMLAGKVETMLATRSRNMVCISRHTLNRIESAGFRAGNPIVSTMGFVIERFRALPSGPKATDLVYVGRLAPHKNIDLALRAVRVIRETVHPGVKFEVVGDGPLRHELERLAAELGLGGNTVFRGDIDEEDVYRSLRAARLLLHPSSREGLGVTVIEAKLCGVPAIVCRGDYNAAMSLVRHRETGFVCEPDADAIARCYQEALVEDLHAALSKNCLAESEAYSMENFVDGLERYYRAVARRGPSSSDRRARAGPGGGTMPL
jgi:glycosyltransferase involved in cell wall biosynthesis